MSEASNEAKNELKHEIVPFRLAVFQSFANIAPAAVVGVFLSGLAGLALGSTPLVAIGAFLIYFLTLNANYQYSKRIANAGGYYGYAGHAANKTVGFYAGMFYLINGIIGGAAFGFLQAAVFAYFLFPNLSSISYLWLLFMTVDAIFVTGITYFGIRPNLLYMTITGIIESAVLYIGALFLIALAGPHNTLSVLTPVYLGNNYSKLFFAILANFTSFIGAGSVITLAEETKNPRKNIGKALIYVIFIGAIPIILSAYAFTVIYGPFNMSSFASLNDPGFLLYMAHLGPFFAYLFAALVINSCLSVGVAIFNATSRTLWGMAREGLFPKFLNYIHPKYKTPSRIILLMAALDYVIAILAVEAFGVYNGYFILGVMVAIPVMSTHLIVNAVLPLFAKKQKMKLTGWTVITHYLAPFASVIIILAAIIVSAYPLPSWPFEIAPIFAGLWALVITLIVVYFKIKNPNALKGTPQNYGEV